MDPIKASLLTAITESLSRRIQSAQEMAQVLLVTNFKSVTDLKIAELACFETSCFKTVSNHCFQTSGLASVRVLVRVLVNLHFFLN